MPLIIGRSGAKKVLVIDEEEEDFAAMLAQDQDAA